MTRGRAPDHDRLAQLLAEREGGILGEGVEGFDPSRVDPENVAGPTGAFGTDDAELLDLLATADLVGTLSEVEPAPRGLRPGRAAFIAAGVSRAQTPEARAGLLGRLTLAWRLAVPAALVLLVMISAAVTTAAADSLPGDALYGLKRAEESLRLRMASATDRSELADSLAERRREEVLALLGLGRSARVTFGCEVSEIIATDPPRVMCRELPGVPVELPQGAELAIGDEIEVTGTTMADRVVAARLLVIDEAAEVVAPDMPSAATEAVVATEAPAATTATPQEAVAELEQTAQPPAPTSTATQTPTLPSTVEAAATATRVAVTPEPTRPVVKEWEGVLESKSGDVWTVAGQAFRVADGAIDTSAGPAVVGARVRVRAEERDGQLWLLRLSVLEAAPAERVELSGTIETIEADHWILDGHTLLLTADTVVEGEPEVGRQAHVIALRSPDGSLTAEHIRVLEPLPRVQFEGILESFDADSWRINRERVFINSATVIEGEPRIGAWVEVEAVRRPDSSLLATRLRVAGTSATVTPTSTAVVRDLGGLPSPILPTPVN